MSHKQKIPDHFPHGKMLDRMIKKAEKEEIQARVYPDPRYVYQPVVVLGSSGKAEIKMVIVECTKTQARAKKPAEAVVDTMDSAIDVDPLITALPNDKLYELHGFNRMLMFVQYERDVHFISIVGKSDFSEIEKYDAVPEPVLELWRHGSVVRVGEDPKLGYRFLRK